MNCGVISINDKSGSAKFELNSLNDIRTKLIPLFDKFPLNGLKYLDYLAFKEGIAIKLNEGLSKDQKHELILGLKDSMNSKRVDFEMPFAHKINITPYWLLGIIEGEASFSISSSNIPRTTFYLSLTSAQGPLIHAIKDFLTSNMLGEDLLKLPLDYQESLRKVIGIYNPKGRGNSKSQVELIVTQTKFLVDKLIPLLSGLTFVTKKYKDFLDWALVSSLIYTGKHTTEKGSELIVKVGKGMNLNRLTTFQKGKAEEIPQSLIDEVLKMEDVYIKGADGLRVHASNPTRLVSGQLFYILAEGLDGESITFKSSESCADYFGVTSATVNSRIVKRLPISNTNKIKFMLSRIPL